MKKKSKNRLSFNNLSKIPRVYWLGFVLVVILTVPLVTSLLSSNSNSGSVVDEPGENEVIKDSNDNAVQETEANGTSQQNASSDKKPEPFNVSKVYFSRAPEPPSDAGFGQCTVGQEIAYTAVVEVTATAPGTMTYNWKTADQLGGISKSYDQETYAFSTAGKVSISKNLVYVARENAGYEGNLWNRQYINFFVSSPNENYANIEDPGAANGVGTYGFVWGTYVDLC